MFHQTRTFPSLKFTRFLYKGFYCTNAEKVVQHVSSQVVKLKIHLLQNLLVLQPWYNDCILQRDVEIVVRQNKFVAQQKSLTYRCFDLPCDTIWVLATYPPQLASRYDLPDYDVKIMFSIIF